MENSHTISLPVAYDRFTAHTASWCSETPTQHHGAEPRWVPFVAVIKHSDQKKLGRRNGLFGFKSEPEVQADDVGTQSLVPPSFSSSVSGGREQSHSHWARSF